MIQMLDFKETRRNEKVYNIRGGRANDFDIFAGAARRAGPDSKLFSLGLGQNLRFRFGPKRNTKLTVNPPPPTENFSKGSRLRMGPRFCM